MAPERQDGPRKREFLRPAVDQMKWTHSPTCPMGCDPEPPEMTTAEAFAELKWAFWDLVSEIARAFLHLVLRVKGSGVRGWSWSLYEAILEKRAQVDAQRQRPGS